MSKKEAYQESLLRVLDDLPSFINRAIRDYVTELEQENQTLRDRQAKRDAEVWAAARLWINGEVFDEKRGMMRGTCYMYDTLEDWEASKK